jgi:hypothetical protein
MHFVPPYRSAIVPVRVPPIDRFVLAMYTQFVPCFFRPSILDPRFRSSFRPSRKLGNYGSDAPIPGLHVHWKERDDLFHLRLPPISRVHSSSPAKKNPHPQITERTQPHPTPSPSIRSPTRDATDSHLHWPPLPTRPLAPSPYASCSATVHHWQCQLRRVAPPSKGGSTTTQHM